MLMKAMWYKTSKMIPVQQRTILQKRTDLNEFVCEYLKHSLVTPKEASFISNG